MGARSRDMRVYLDANCFNRPFDDQAQLRIRNPVEYVGEATNAEVDE
jgi:hypothetical protein